MAATNRSRTARLSRVGQFPAAARLGRYGRAADGGEHDDREEHSFTWSDAGGDGGDDGTVDWDSEAPGSL
jgi:hypothetical protein